MASLRSGSRLIHGKLLTNSIVFRSASRRLYGDDLFLEARAPVGRVLEHVGELVAVLQVFAQVLQNPDQRVERGADLVGVGGGNVAPDVGGARGEARRVGEPS